MASNLFFIPRFQVFKALTKISIYDILTNNFNVNPSKRLKPQFCVPIEKFLNEITKVIYLKNSSEETVNYNWLRHCILLVQIFNLSKCLFYIFWNEDDQLSRLYYGDLTQFFGLNSKFYSIPQAGISFYSLAIFFLFQYLIVNQLSWLKIFNSIQGKKTFVSSKIFLSKSVKNLIRLSLIVVIICTYIIYSVPIFVLIYYLFLTFTNLTWNQFISYAVPWIINDTIWVHLDCCYFYASLIVIIICYYYELRLNQLNVYVDLYLKHKRFNRINQQIDKLLTEYTEIITEMNQFNKFVSKVIFYLLLFCSSTFVFLIYNMIYVKIDLFMYLLYIVFCSNFSSVIILIVLSTIRIANEFNRNKCNLIKLNYIKNLAIKNKIKVSYFIKIILE